MRACVRRSSSSSMSLSACVRHSLSEQQRALSSLSYACVRACVLSSLPVAEVQVHEKLEPIARTVLTP